MAEKKKKRKLTDLQKQKRQEYSRTRDIVRKRIMRAQAKGELLNQEIPPKLSELSSGRQISKELAVMEKFLGSPWSTAAGRAIITEKRFQGYRNAGYVREIKNEEGEVIGTEDVITPANEKMFTKFMNHMIKKYKDETPNGKRMFHDSDTFASFFDDLVEKDKLHEKTRLSDLVRMFNRWVGD